MRSHGHCKNGKLSPTYSSWTAMWARCIYPSAINWKKYGGRGIKVHPRWEKFENFLADMGERPAGKTLDRFPNRDGNYEPGNCRWATREEQQRNRDDNRMITHAGETLSLVEWAKRVGIHPETISGRIDHLGWSVEDALSKKARGSLAEITWRGRTLTLKQWAKRLRISYTTLYNRARRGLSPEEILKR